MAAGDWRLERGRGEFLRGGQLFLRAWIQTRPDWDHDHCEFCWVKFGSDELVARQAGIEVVLRAGWTTDDERTWICENCFSDFREHFQWRT